MVTAQGFIEDDDIPSQYTDGSLEGSKAGDSSQNDIGDKVDLGD